MRQPITAILFAAAVVQASCTPLMDETATPATDRSPAAPAKSATPTLTNDGVVVELTPLTQADIAAANLPPELGCSFSSSDGALLVAKGFVGGDEPARGVVKIASKLEPLVASNVGYEGMSAEGVFTGRGLMFDVEQRGAPSPDFESQTSAAQLAILRGGEVERLIDGSWTCGP